MKKVLAISMLLVFAVAGVSFAGMAAKDGMVAHEGSTCQIKAGATTYVVTNPDDNGVGEQVCESANGTQLKVWGDYNNAKKTVAIKGSMPSDGSVN